MKIFSQSFFLFIFIFVQTLIANQLFISGYQDMFSESWRWQAFPELNGRGCRCIAEDVDGNLWFGINGGVLKYDGLKWDFYFTNGDSTNDPVIALCASSDNTLYVGTNSGISSLKNGEWRFLDIDLGYGDQTDFPNNRLSIIEGVDKSIWIGTHQGLLRIKNNILNLYRPDAVIPNLQNRNIDFQEIRDLPPINVFSIYEDEQGVLWIGLSDGKIFRCRYDPNDISARPKWTRVDLEEGYVPARYPLITIANNGNVLVCSGEIRRGINIYNGKKWEQFNFYQEFNINDVHTDVLKMNNGTILVGVSSGVFAYNEKKWLKYINPDLLLPQNRWNFFETSREGLWIFGLGGEVWRVDLSTKKWSSFKGVHFIAQDLKGDNWFLSYDGAVIKTNSTMQALKRYDDSDGLIDTPTSLYVTKRGQIWAAGSHRQIAATAYFEDNKWHRHLHPTLSWSIDHRAVMETRDGSLWFGSCADKVASKGHRGGLVRYLNPFESKDKFEYYYFNEKFELFAIYGIGQSQDGKLFVGEKLLYQFDAENDSWELITSPSGIDKSFIDCIHTSQDGNVWVGTRANGLFMYNHFSQDWKNYTTLDGLSSNSIIAVLAKSDSNVWVATERNICHFDGESWMKEVFPNFVGLHRPRFKMLTAKDGSIWFNLIPSRWLSRALYPENSLERFRNDFISYHYIPDKIPPETVITFSQNQVSQPGNVYISWFAHDPWRSTPDELLLYSYRIDDETWSPFSFKTGNIFLNLPDGDHTFEVRSRDQDMNLDPVPAHVSFSVIPPIWKKVWFISLIIFFLLTITVFIFFLQHRNKIIRNLSLAREQMFTNISHELRTPLTLIIGNANKIQECVDPNSIIYLPVTLLSRSCDRLFRLVNQILDFEKLESGVADICLKKGDIIAYIRQVVEAFQVMANENHKVLKINTTINELDIWFDPDKIEKILFNLLSNAFKFTEKDGLIQLSLSIESGSTSQKTNLQNDIAISYKDYLIITLVDNGCGIPEEKLDKIFSRFYRLHNHTVLNNSGCGIGLSLVKGVVELLGGTINVKSKEEKGTTFTVALPLINEYFTDNRKQLEWSDSATNIKLQMPKQIEKSRDLKNVKKETKVLLVEDNFDLRKFLRHELESEYKVFEATDGKDGLTASYKLIPDIIISDVMMPNMDGIEFCKSIKGDERTSHIPIILLTARTLQKNKIEGLQYGADDYLTKPFDVKELKLRIQNIIEARKRTWLMFQRDVRLQPTELQYNSLDENFINRAIEIIEKHIDDPDLDPKKFGEIIGMSRAGLYNKIRTLTGKSVNEFIILIRLKRAAQLIEKSGLNVTQIAYEVGFKSPSHFAKAFKKQFGTIPSKFKNNSKEI